MTDAKIAAEHRREARVPEGYVLVPVEPTEEMVAVGDEEMGSISVYKAMIAAAKAPE